MLCLFSSIKQCVSFCFHTLQEHVLRWIKPSTTSFVLGTFADLTRGKAELLAENALLRQQLIILHREVKRPTYRKTDRLLLVLLARMVRTWKQALLLVQPETLLRWHRELFRLFWKRTSKAHERKPKLSSETISLIKEMAANNRLWGAESIRGELLKLDIRVSKRTIQKYMRPIRRKRLSGQTWKTFLRNHAAEIWACDFLQVPDLFFRPLFAFFIIELQSRKVIHVNVTRSPSDPWVAQQLREATPYGHAPNYLIRDNDRKFGPEFARVATTSCINVLRTPYRTPQANAICERFLGSVRRECLDHFLIFQEKQLYRLLKAYVVYFNQARPHQGLGQRIPDPSIPSTPLPNSSNQVSAIPVLGGLHHNYRRAA
ncbi:Integrase catalytic region [Ktedonobacter racemifer DSM 44963]|uniref:Integrase catalytic region n=1 Tax=Ktedonobacter racemifer DSM 44963 TaxID=485913 RepID=D6U1E9_KTERA|nr:Integrase catalytic region [Ktedonobacter racemifer DSM 44963]